jgi:D-alanine transfer protein
MPHPSYHPAPRASACGERLLLARGLLQVEITTALDTDPGGRGVPPDRLPLGILAALLAVGIAVGVAGVARTAVRRAARRDVHRIAADEGPVKFQSLFLQRAALEDGRLLPLYGSSELYCCGDPYRATQVFTGEPSGFDAFAVGGAGISNLIFVQMFGALGADLRGKRLVLLNSPPWFTVSPSYRQDAYADHFSPEIAAAFIFGAPLSIHLREAVARQMLAYPRTLDGNLLLRLGVKALARPSGLHRVTYRLLAPLGRIEAWIEESRGAVRTLLYLRHHHVHRAPPAPVARELDWAALASDATDIAVHRDTTNPFGIPDRIYRRMMRDAGTKDAFDRALAMYRSGDTNRDGRRYPAPVAWQETMSRSEEWTDLHLVTAVLQELGARPFLWTIPLAGFYQDYTAVSAPVRRDFYGRWEHMVRRTGFDWLDFREADEDRYFVTGAGGHFGPRGWVFADYALDLWWHGYPADEIRRAMGVLAEHAPEPPLAAVQQVVEEVP